MRKVIPNLVSGVDFGLDIIGTRMWQFIFEHRSAVNVVAAPLDKYKVEEDQVRGDLQRLIGQLIDKELVITDPATTPLL